MSVFSRFFAKDDRPLPHFVYHPDPVATGALKPESAICPCCEKRTAWVYARTPYCTDEVPDLCPWCIADGSAARKYDATFVDDHSLVQAGLKREIVDEVARSWQSEAWLVCCADACEFHGDLAKEELAKLPADTIVAFRTEHRIDDRNWDSLLDGYEPGGSPAIYKFVCRHCRKIHLGFDFD